MLIYVFAFFCLLLALLRRLFTTVLRLRLDHGETKLSAFVLSVRTSLWALCRVPKNAHVGDFVVPVRRLIVCGGSWLIQVVASLTGHALMPMSSTFWMRLFPLLLQIFCGVPGAAY